MIRLTVVAIFSLLAAMSPVGRAQVVCEYTFDNANGGAWTLGPLAPEIGAATLTGQIPVIGEDYWYVDALGTSPPLLRASSLLDNSYFEIEADLTAYSSGFLRFSFEAMIDGVVSDSVFAVSYSTDNGVTYTSWATFPAPDSMTLLSVDAGNIPGGLIGGNVRVRVTHERTAAELVDGWFDNLRLQVVPEPSTGLLAVVGMLSLAVRWPRRR